MKKSILLISFFALFLTFNTVVNGQNQSEIPEVYEKYSKEFSKVKIPIYIPTHLPMPHPVTGPLYLHNARFNEKSYSFEVFNPIQFTGWGLFDAHLIIK